MPKDGTGTTGSSSSRSGRSSSREEQQHCSGKERCK